MKQMIKRNDQKEIFQFPSNYQMLLLLFSIPRVPAQVDRSFAVQSEPGQSKQCDLADVGLSIMGDPNGWVSWKIHWKSQSKLDDLGIFPFTLDGLSPGLRKIPRFSETAIFLAVLSFGKKPAKRSTENLRKLSPQFMALW